MPTGNTGGVQSATNISGNAQAVSNMTQSSRGPLAVPISPDWTVQQSYLVDLSIQNQFGTIDMVQTLFMDNSQSSAPLYAVNAVSQQTIICPAKSQGYFPFLCPQPSRFTLMSTGGVRASIECLNFPVQPAVWGAAGQLFTFNDAGALITQDSTLAQVSVIPVGLNNALAVDVVATVGGGGGTSFQRFNSLAEGGGSGGVHNILAAGAAQHIQVHSAWIVISPECYIRSGTSGLVHLALSISGEGEIISTDVWLPGAPPALGTLVTAAYPAILSFSDLDILSAAVGHTLQYQIVDTATGAAVDIGAAANGGVNFITAAALI